MTSAAPLRLVVLGTMGRHPYGGQTWLYLNWMRGLARLGHEVWYVEDATTWPYDPIQRTRPPDCMYARRHIECSLRRVGLEGRWALRVAGLEGACWGLGEDGLEELYRSCDALLNVAGSELDERQLAAPFRVYVQTDPVTSELRLAQGDDATRRMFAAHDRVATYGENYGAPDCGVPTNGIRYVRTRQPIDLDLWPSAWTPNSTAFTTIGNYRQEGWDVVYNGEVYPWSKHVEWERFLDLPRATGRVFQPALSSLSGSDRERLEAHGWRVQPAFARSLDVFGRYPELMRRSRAAFTPAKAQNVRLRSGWFSEREACYLASGKPVVTQDTGFGATLPTGAGLFAVADLAEAAAAVEEIDRDYVRHCRAARAIAEECFEARGVAARLLGELGLA